MNTEHRQNCTVMVSLCILNIEKIMFKRWRYINRLSNSKRFPLRTTKTFIEDASICENSTLQLSSKHLKFLPLHYEFKSWHHAKFQLFWIILHLQKIWKQKSPFSRWFPTIILHIWPAVLLHKAYKCDRAISKFFLTTFHN